jgi:hypothetical protein
LGVVAFVNKTYDRGAWMEADKKKKIRGRPFLFVYNTYSSVKKNDEWFIITGYVSIESKQVDNHVSKTRNTSV